MAAAARPVASAPALSAAALVAHAATAQRVAGWDLLRGLCALAVASYHLLHWQGLADLNSLASYAVYLFFVLSGASLAYTYGERLNGVRPVLRFWWTRWWRLAPLYALVCGVWLWMLGQHLGTPVDRQALRLALNLSFAFGLFDPVVWALPVGGWSLGIEFVFYLLCPLLLWALRHPAGTLALLLPVAALQVAWIALTLGAPGDYGANSVAYHQVPAFAAYFFAGCLIGQAQRQGLPPLSLRAGLVVWAAMGALLLAAAPPVAGQELLGWRGGVLPVACALCVWASGRVRLAGGAARLAAALGDLTYGAYLLHPMVFFGFTWFVLPPLSATPVEQLPAGLRWAMLVAGLALTCGLAMLSERWFERPLRQAGRRWLRLGERAPRPQRDSASIAS